MESNIIRLDDIRPTDRLNVKAVAKNGRKSLVFTGERVIEAIDRRPLPDG